MKLMKKSKAQQLVEFLFVAPFIIIVLGILMEYAYALNVNMTLNEGLKTVTSSIYGQITPSPSGESASARKTRILGLVSDALTTYMKENNTPMSFENNLSVDYAIGSEDAVFVAKYTYYSAFTLPNVYIHVLPEKFDFVATAVIPAAFLKSNNYDNLDSRALDKIWSTAGFSALNAFQASERGILNNSATSTNNRTNSIAFFVYPRTNFDIGDGVKLSAYQVVDWSGKNLSGDESKPWYAVPSLNQIYSVSGSVNTYVGPILQMLPNITNIIVFDGFTSNGIPTAYWASGCTASTLSDSSASNQCVLKATLSLDEGSNSVGNYDNYKPIGSTYNPNLNTPIYTVDTFGSLVVMHPNPVVATNWWSNIQLPPVYAWKETTE